MEVAVADRLSDAEIEHFRSQPTLTTDVNFFSFVSQQRAAICSCN